MIKSIRDFDVSGKRILVRCDFNVPLDEKGNITDTFRIIQGAPTIKYLIEKNAKIILMCHLDPESTGVADKKFNLNKVAEFLSGYLNIDIEKENDCIGQDVQADINKLKNGNVLLLENLRFHKEETENNLEFAKKIASLGDIFVNDAFGADHRAHASLVGIPQFLPSCSGLLLEKEMSALDKVMKNPEKPMVAIIGGTKVETKSKFINKISEVADFVIISGLLKKEIMEKNIVFLHPEKIIGPADNLAALDIDEKTIKLFSEKIMQAKNVLWNGPFGKFEEEKYAKGTMAIASAIITSKAFSVVGGGETVEFLEKQGIIEKFSHVSTGGGAMISYLSGDALPGIEALNSQ